MQLVLLSAAAAMAGLLSHVASNPIGSVVPAAERLPAALDAAVSPGPVRPIADLGSLTATRDRPLFSPSRRPPQAAAQDATPPGADPALIELIGTLTAADGGRALLRTRDSQTGAWVGIGETLAGWRVSAIAKDSVVIEAAGRSVELTLYPTKVPSPL